MAWMNRGKPLTADESEHVMAHLTERASSERNWCGVTSEFIRELGWPQRRMPDVRGFLERESTRAELSERLGESVAEVFMSRSQVFVQMGEPSGYNRPEPDFTKVEAALKAMSDEELVRTVVEAEFPELRAMVGAEVLRRLGDKT